MANELFDREAITTAVRHKMEEIAVGLMNAENKNYCLASVNLNDWHLFSIERYGNLYVAVPSMAFNRFVFNREYLKIVDAFPAHFGAKNDWEIVRAMKEHDSSSLVREYSDEEYLDYIKGETTSYIFQIQDGDTLSNKVLRLDLCRGINKNNVFMGGIFHILKHFTLGGYETISSFGKEFSVESWGEIYHNIIINFFSNEFRPEKGKENYYESFSTLTDGHRLRGVYFKNPEVPVYFLDSLRVDG